jgi:hypothetical protein
MGNRPENMLMQQLLKAAQNYNFDEYTRLVNTNMNIINGMSEDYWAGILGGDEDIEEMEFWIEYPGRRFDIAHLRFLAPYGLPERVFQKALRSPNLDLRRSDVLIDYFQKELGNQIEDSEEESSEEEDDGTRVFRNRLKQIKALITSLISFPEAARMLNNGLFKGFDFLPEYQNRKINPNNLIASFYGKDGRIYLAELRYNQTTHQILPPL